MVVSWLYEQRPFIDWHPASGVNTSSDWLRNLPVVWVRGIRQSLCKYTPSLGPHFIVTSPSPLAPIPPSTQAFQTHPPGRKLGLEVRQCLPKQNTDYSTKAAVNLCTRNGERERERKKSSL